MKPLLAGASLALLALVACSPKPELLAEPAALVETATVAPQLVTIAAPAGDYVANHPGTKFKSREDDLANSGNFLNAKQFPEIGFVSISTEVSGERTAKVTGDLTLHGVTKPVTLEVTFDGETAEHALSKVPALGFSATATLKRSDFGMDYLLPSLVGDDVQVQIEGDFIQKKPA
jgi:polyisoprenoid-binding protein YceI